MSEQEKKEFIDALQFAIIVITDLCIHRGWTEDAKRVIAKIVAVIERANRGE